MISRDIKKPVEPQKPDDTYPIFEESPAWNEYHEKKKQYEHDIELYNIKSKFLEKFDSLEPKIMLCLDGDRESIVQKLEQLGITADRQTIEAYVESIKTSKSKIDGLRQVLANIEKAEARDTVGISFLNDKLKQSGKIDREVARQKHYRQMFTERIAGQVVLSEYSYSDFNEMKKVYDALKDLGYEEGFGELEKFIPAFEQINGLQNRNIDLERDNKKLKDEKQLLLVSNSEIQKENDQLHSENKQLHDENKQLNQRMEQIVQNVKKYKDFVLETVRKMPVIGKVMAKKIQKDEKRLPSGVER